MSILAEHSIKFNEKQLKMYFYLIYKYYGSLVGCIDVEGVEHIGELKKFFLSAHINGNFSGVKSITVSTISAAAFVMPKYIKSSSMAPNSKLLKIARQIDSAVSHRLNQWISLRKKVDYDNIQELYCAIPYIESNSVTRVYAKNEFCILVIHDSIAISISDNCAKDAKLPSFNIDTGFISRCADDDDCCKKLVDCLNLEFNNWRKKFDQTHGANWNDPILF